MRRGTFVLAHLATPRTEHPAAPEVKPRPRFGVFETISRAELPCDCQTGNQAVLLRVDDGVCAAMPGVRAPLHELKRVHQHRDMEDVVHDMLKTVACDDLARVDRMDG